MTFQNPLIAAYDKSAERTAIRPNINKAVDQFTYHNTKLSTKKPTSSRRVTKSLKRLRLSQIQVAESKKATVFTLKDPFAKKGVPIKVFIANDAGETFTFYSARGATHSECSVSGGGPRSR